MSAGNAAGASPGEDDPGRAALIQRAQLDEVEPGALPGRRAPAPGVRTGGQLGIERRRDQPAREVEDPKPHPGVRREGERDRHQAAGWVRVTGAQGELPRLRARYAHRDDLVQEHGDLTLAEEQRHEVGRAIPVEIAGGDLKRLTTGSVTGARPE